MNRSLVNNAVIGTSKGYEKTLELVGVGYRASLKDKKLSLQLGFSHDIKFDIPENIKIRSEKEQIKQTKKIYCFLSPCSITKIF